MYENADLQKDRWTWRHYVRKHVHLRESTQAAELALL